MWQVRMTKHRSTWHYFTENPQGGGFGSNHCGTQTVALNKALRSVPVGARYRLTINDKDRGIRTRADGPIPTPRMGKRLEPTTARELYDRMPGAFKRPGRG